MKKRRTLKVTSMLLALIMVFCALPLTSALAVTAEDALEGFKLGENFTITSEVVQDGQSAIKHTSAEESTMSIGAVDVKKNETYLLTGWLRRADASGVAKLTVKGEGVEVNVESEDVGRWTYYSKEINSGENTQLTVTATGKGEVYFDAIGLKGKAVPEENLITNGGFEDGTMGWGGGTVQGSVTHNESKGALQGGGPMQTIDVEKDTWYIVSGYIYRADKNQWTYIDMNDMEGEVQLRATNDDLIGDWEYVCGLWNSKENTSVPIRIISETNWDDPVAGHGQPAGGLAYVDDISVVKASVGNELLADPNFDKGRWELEGDMSYTYDVYYQETPGLAAGKVTKESPSIATANDGDFIEVQADTDYFISGWFLRTAGFEDSAWGGKTVKGEMQILDEEGNILASFTGSRYNQHDWHYNPTITVKNGHWEYVAGLWNSGGHTKVKVRIIVEKTDETQNPAGQPVEDTMYFEEMSFRQAATSTVSENLLSYNVNMFDEKAENELMNGNFDLQFKANARFAGAVIDPEGKMGESISYELYKWVDSYKRTLQNTPLEKKTIEIEQGKKFINLSFKKDYEPGEYLLVVKYDGEIIKYASDFGTIYTESINSEKAVPRMQIVFTDENSDCFSAVTANNGFEYVADYNAPTDAEKTANRAEYEGYIEDLSTFPTSMSIGGKQIVGFPEDVFTKVSQNMVEEEDNHSEHTTTVLTYKEFEGLQFTIESYYYPDYAAFDWTIYYENTSESENTPIIKDIQAVDMTMDGGDQYLLTNKGDAGRYAAEEYSLVGMRKIYKPTTGRSTQGAYPYYNFEYGDGGSLIAVGWNGQWQATFDAREEGKTNFTAGQELFNAYLKPGEKMRTPLVAFIRYDGRDTDRAINLWRRWLINCNLRKVTDGPDDTSGEKHLFDPQISGGTSVLYHEMTQATDDNQIAAIKWYKDNDIDISFWWMDAGWYYKTSNEGANEGKGQSLDDWGWGNTGVWQVDTKRFPSKMKAISDFGETVGVHTLLWFEPERIGDFSCCLKDGTTVDKDWVLSGALVDLGNPEAVEWFKQRITKILGEGGIYMYREDFNIAPLSYWRGADASDRQGITENKYIQGHMELWDYILEEYPYVTIDSCASGGNRNDLETYRRAVALHKTDLNYGDTTMQQGIEYAYNQWNVYYGSKANGDGDHGTEYASKYALRTATCPWMVLGYSTHEGIPNPDGVGYIAGEETPLDTYIIRDAVDQQWATSEYIYADYYPLTALDQTEENWIGWEYYDETKGSGYALAFRRSMGAAQQKLRLKGLDPKENYTVYFEDRNDYGTYSGAQLMYDGILWTLPADRTSDILWINRASNNIEERDLTVNVTGPSVNELTQNWTTGEVRAAIYEKDGSYEFAIRLNMALRDTFFGIGEGRYEKVDLAEYGDLITVNGKTLNEIDEVAPGTVTLEYDVDLHILNVFIAKNNNAGFAPDKDNTVIIDGLVTEQGVEMAKAAVFNYAADEKSWEVGDNTDIPVNSITITNTETEIATGTPVELKAEVDPESRLEDVVWSIVSGDATINGNELVANKAGEIVVKAAIGDIEDTITLHAVTYCEDFNITNMNLNPEKGDKGKYEVTFTPEDCSQEISYKSSNPDVLKVDENGNWEAVSAGEAKLMAACGDVTKTYDILVKDDADNPGDPDDDPDKPDKPSDPDDPDKPDKPGDQDVDNPTDPDAPKTGDNGIMWIWAVLFAAAAGITVVFVRKAAWKAKK